MRHGLAQCGARWGAGWRLTAAPVRAVAWAMLCAAGLAQAAQTANAATLQVTDDRGRTVTLAAPPQRVVSLLPSLTETVCELGQCHRLVGVDRYSNHPVAVRSLPQLGGGLDPNIEAVVARRPDLVLVSASSRAADRFESLGLKVVVLEPKNHADVQRVMGKVAQALGVPDAEAQRIWRYIDAGVQAATQALRPERRHVRVYFEVNRAPYAAGPSSFIGETLTRLGVRNIIPADLGPFPKINPEFVVRADPDVIMVGARNFDGMTSRPGWQRLRALRDAERTRTLCVFSLDESDVLVRPGPRMAEAARLMVDCLNGQRHPIPAGVTTAGPLPGAKH